ncbi:MAG: putative bifunctional diguanylate cyclase/phosphodiesterase, partial [Acidimicrobiales bacterium]
TLAASFLTEFASRRASAEPLLTSALSDADAAGHTNLAAAIPAYRSFLATDAVVVSLFNAGRPGAATALALGAGRQSRTTAQNFLAAAQDDLVRAATAGQAHVGRLSNLLGLQLVLLAGGLVVAAIEVARRLKRQRATTETLRQSEQQSRTLVARMPAAVYSVTLEGVVTAWNPGAVAMFGWTEAEAVGQMLPIVSPNEFHDYARNRAETAAGRMLSGLETIRHRRDGTAVNVSISTAPILDATGRVVSIIAMTTDITERTRAAAEAELHRHREQMLAAIVSSSADAIISTSLGGALVSWNAGAEAMFGYSAAEAIGEPIFMLTRPADAPANASIAHAVLAGHPMVGHETIGMCKDGREIAVALTASPVFEGGEVVGMSAVVRDISTQKALEATLERRALHDHLTGLPNRVLFVDRLRLAISRLARHGGLLAVLFVDIDHFKVINESLGHEQGDRLLALMAQRFAGAVRPGDTVARFGGDEFAVLCESVLSEAEAVGIAERLQELAAVPLRLDGRDFTMTVSTGIALTASSDALAADLLRDADSAMYQAKDAGRGCSVTFVPSMKTRADQRLDTEVALRRAIRDGQLRLHYQPIVNLTTGRTEGVEALVRWQHPTEGLIAPSEFIPLAEETGLLVPLGEWVLGEACRQAQSWHREYPELDHLTVSVNLSGRQIAQADLVAVVANVLATTALPASRLVLEITESVLMRNVAHTIAVLTALKALGVRLSIDDFGTGYSSLSYLKQFPVDILKIDKSFVDGLDDGDQDTAIVAATIHLAHSLGLKTIAEGTETAIQIITLTELGCDNAQGFLLCRPQPPETVIEVLVHPIAHPGGWIIAGGAPGRDIPVGLGRKPSRTGRLLSFGPPAGVVQR